MIERIKKSFCILLTLTLAVTMLLPVNSISSYAAAGDTPPETYEEYYSTNLSDLSSDYIFDVPQDLTTDPSTWADELATRMQTATSGATVLINLKADIPVYTGSSTTSGLCVKKGSKTTWNTVVINGGGYRIYASDLTEDDETTAYTRGSALLCAAAFTELVLYDVTVDGAQKERGIYANCNTTAGRNTVCLYDKVTITNGAKIANPCAGSGIYLIGKSATYQSTLYMYEGSAVTNCVGGNTYDDDTSYSTNGTGIYGSYAGIHLHGTVCGCTIADTSTGITKGTIYLNQGCEMYIYDSAEISNNSAISSANTDNAKDGGAIYAAKSSNIYMYDGVISNNTAQNGGAVYLNQSSCFYMYGGTITGNTAQEGDGGAIYSAYTATSSNSVAISADSADVQITGNTAVNGSGAGIYNRSACSITATGDYAVTITGNYDVVTETDDSGTETETSRTAGDVYDWTTSTTTSLALARDVSIGRIYVVEDQTLTLESALTGSIGFYLQVDEDNGGHALADDEELVVVKAGDGYALTYSDLNHFSSENTAYRLAFGT
ncbi:MAG: hypothetical protein LUG54_03715, partial [Clostridiales bacterium]|nr:hypothetical protein [Clostridiales bacterium]